LIMGTRVFVGGLKDPRIRERDVEDFFKGFGRIREVILKGGYGFVEFEDLQDAEDAVYEKNGKSLNGERVVVEHAMRPGSGPGPGRRDFRRRSPPRQRMAPRIHRTKYRIQIENVSSRASWRDLKALMQNAGEVAFCDAHRHVNGEGHCEFESRKGMERALDELDGRELHGKRIKLREARSRTRSPARRRRSRSRSKSRSRSQRRSKSGSRSKSRSKSPAKRKEKEAGSKSGSRSKSPAKKTDKNKSRSRSPAKKRSQSRSKSPVKKSNRSQSRSKSPAKKSNRSQSRSKSPAKKSNRSKSRSKSPAKKPKRSRSRSKSPARKASERSKSPKRGRKSRSRSRSATPSK